MAIHQKPQLPLRLWQRCRPAFTSSVRVPIRMARERAPVEAREILSAIPAAIYTTDADGYLTHYNERASELWGYRPEIGKQRWCGTFKIFLMDGTPVPHDRCPMATAVRTGKPVYGIEAIGERPDGRRVPCAVDPAPMFDASGKIVGGVNMRVDISERKAIEERQSILIQEMDHRIRNNLANIEVKAEFRQAQQQWETWHDCYKWPVQAAIFRNFEQPNIEAYRARVAITREDYPAYVERRTDCARQAAARR